MVATITTGHIKIITGRKIRNRSLKIVENETGKFQVIFTQYFLGRVLKKRIKDFETMSDAQIYYDRLGIEKFKGFL